MSDQQQTLSIPSLLLLAALSALAVRYFFFSTPGSSSSSSSSRSNSRTANPADVEQISQMFPQIPRRDIMWDLQRNGGSVAATTERVLSRGTLETPPPTFQPPLPSPGQTPPSTSRISPSYSTPETIDLIKRYNLSSKLSNPSPSPAAPEAGNATSPAAQIPGGGGGGGWSNSRTERQAILQRRRDDMVLTARRKMEERERERKGEGRRE